MKCTIVTMLFVIIISSVFGTYVIPRTITVDTQTLSALRSSLLPANPYYDPYIADLSDSDVIVMPEEDDSLPLRDFPLEMSKMNEAVKYFLEDALFSEGLDVTRINNIVNILSYDIPPASTALNFFTDTSYEALDRALLLVYYTQNAAMLYDCLYYTSASLVPDSIKIKLRDILRGAIQLTEDTINSYSGLSRVDHSQWGVNLPRDYQYPGFSIIQYRFQMLAASGLAALLLRETVPEWVDEMNEHLDYVNNEYLHQPMPSTFPPSEQFQGMLALHTGNSGAFIESLGYQSSMHQRLSPFFTAYKRLSGGSVNYYNNQYYVTLINDLIAKGAPTGANWPYNDDYANEFVSPGPVIFYYNNTNSDAVREKCPWYYKSKPSWTYPYQYTSTSTSACPSNLLVRYLSDPFILPRLSSINSVPSFLSQGSQSNSEFTILREPIIGDITEAISEFTDVASMFITEAEIH